MFSLARRLLGELARTEPEVEPRHGAEAAVVLRAAAVRALDRVRRGKGPAPFTGDERVLLHAAALPALIGAQEDPVPGVSSGRVEQVVNAVSLVFTARLAERVQARLQAAADGGGTAARDLAAAALLDPITLAVRAATSTPRAETDDEHERELLQLVFSSRCPPLEVLDALAGCYLARGDLQAAANVRTARELSHGR